MCAWPWWWLPDSMIHQTVQSVWWHAGRDHAFIGELTNLFDATCNLFDIPLTTLWWVAAVSLSVRSSLPCSPPSLASNPNTLLVFEVYKPHNPSSLNTYSNLTSQSWAIVLLRGPKVCWIEQALWSWNQYHPQLHKLHNMRVCNICYSDESLILLEEQVNNSMAQQVNNSMAQLDILLQEWVHKRLPISNKC